ncbi:MAG: hypothetical protein IKJ68_00510 [Clostridia bacterium]|nr:hypothetical protein [Clostridia bacterium]
MKDYILELEKRLDKSWLTEHILNLYQIERLQTFPAYIKSAEYVYNLLKSEGFEAELVNIPADGKTVYQDVRMPIGWDVQNMTLKLLTPIEGIENGILADYSQNPCSAVKHSVGTPPQGVDALVVSEDDFKNGADVNDCFVLFNQETRPGRNDNIKSILDNGAIGWISDFCENPGEAPNYTAWLNSGTETGSWHVQADDRDFIGYQITPNHGDALRKAYSSQKIYVKAYSDAKRYESVLPFVSALLPGKNKKEIWVMAHMFEPLIDDNANGVIGSIAILKALRDMVKDGKAALEYSVRVIFASEVYGFTSAAEYYGGNLKNRTLAGINMDGLPASKEKGMHRQWRIFEAPDYPANAANIILHQVEISAKEIHPQYSFTTHTVSFGDDQVLGDSTIGLPTAWFLRGGYNCFHHNSILTDKYLDIDVFFDTLTLSGTWICAMATLNSEKIKKILPTVTEYAQKVLNTAAHSELRSGTDAKAYLEFLYNREKQRILSLSVWADIPEITNAAESINIPESYNTYLNTDNSVLNKLDNYVFSRKTRGLPLDMTRIPDRKEQFCRGLFIYFSPAQLMPYMDGVKTLKTIVTEYEWMNGKIISDKQLEENLKTYLHLTKYGYLDCNTNNN